MSDSAQYEQEAAIMVNTWQRAGIDARQQVYGQAQSQDTVFRASFPTMNNNSGAAEPASLRYFSSGQIPRADNRFTGSNRGGWSNAEYDRLFAVVNSTLDRTERVQALVQGMKIATEETVGLFLYCNLRGFAHVASLQGPQQMAPRSNSSWSVHEWEWR